MRYLVVLMLCVAGSISTPAQDAPPKRPFTPAKDTTVVLGHARPDGTIDYLAALNELSSQGVTKDNNAAIPLLEAIGADDGARSLRRARAKLGLPETAPTFLDLHRFAAETARANDPPRDPLADADAPPPSPRDQLEKLLDRALDRPWRDVDAPVVARWLARVGPHLDRAVEASLRTRYHVPLLPEREPGVVMSMSLPHYTGVRGVVTALKARALLRLGSGDFDGFRLDAFAAVRVGRLISQEPVLIGKLVAAGCEATGHTAVRAAATSGLLTALQARALLADLAAAPPASPVWTAYDTGERFMLLDQLVVQAVYGPTQSARYMKGDTRNLKRFDTSAHDWDAGMRKVNRWYDRLVDVGKQPTYPQQLAAGNAFGRDLDDLRGRVFGLAGAFAEIEDRLLVMLAPALARAYQNETRLAADIDLNRVALALAAHRAEQGAYPPTLDALVPKYLPAIPPDRFTGQPLTYHQQAAGYALHSVGINQKDDTGDDTRKNDDQVVRVE
jgi:hypothetical protein